MKWLLFFSDFIIPFLIFYIVGFGILMKRPVYDDFVRGAKEGIHTVVKILPALTGLMVAVGVLRASGFLDWMGMMLQPLAEKIHFPGELIPVTLVRFFSSSAANGLLLDIFKNHGPDSYTGFLGSVILGCTEALVYTMSIYFAAAKVTKTRWTIPVSLISTLAGIAAGVIITGAVF